MTDRAPMPLLVPSARTITRLGPDLEALPASETVRADAAMPEGATTITIGPRTIDIVTAEGPAARHGARAALAQLRRQYTPGSACPSVRIEHVPVPDLRRGVMLDVSRDRVPTMAELLGPGGLVEALSELRFDHLQLYTEHTFAYPGHEAFWRGCGAITPEELRRIDHACARLGIELSANQNCFGHLAGVLSTPGYGPKQF